MKESKHARIILVIASFNLLIIHRKHPVLIVKNVMLSHMSINRTNMG